jgi:hypothetical protein
MLICLRTAIILPLLRALLRPAALLPPRLPPPLGMITTSYFDQI